MAANHTHLQHLQQPCCALIAIDALMTLHAENTTQRDAHNGLIRLTDLGVRHGETSPLLYLTTFMIHRYKERLQQKRQLYGDKQSYETRKTRAA